MSSLPIYRVRDEIVAALRAGPAVIVEAPTGSGKSTQVPQMLLDSGLAGAGRIVVLQPRRLAARMLARRVAEERGVLLGREVGYQVRFDNSSRRDTRIKFETDGIILRELQGDPHLKDVSVIVFDEFHERHLYSDIMLGLAKQLQAGARPDLKLVVMSATLEADALVDYFGSCPVVRTEGRTFPIEMRYLKPNASVEKLSPWELVGRELPRLLSDQPKGDVLVFMPGAYEIRRTIETVKRLSLARDCLVVPLYGDLSAAEQDRAVGAADRRKIIVSTNVAETSLTIEGIAVVIDSGLVRRSSFDPRRGINTLLIEKSSQASAAQRAGRAGRTAPGICLRLWTERSHAKRIARDLPELLRVDLAETLLQLKQAGIESLATFPWVTPPPAPAVERAVALLQSLGAMDAEECVTPMGSRMVAFPLHPRIARMLIAAEHYGCVPTMCLVAALLQERSILQHRVGAVIRDRRLDLLQGREDSDVLLMLKAWEEAQRNRFKREACEAFGVHAGAARSAGVLQRQLERTSEAQGLDCFEVQPQPESIYRSLLAGFSDHVAIRTGGDRCSLVGGRRGTVSPDSVLNRQQTLFVAAEIQEIGSRQGQVDVRLSALTAIREEWLCDLFPGSFREQRRVYYDTVGKRMLAERQRCFRDLVIGADRAGDVTHDEAAAALAAEVVAGRLVMKRWDRKVEQWIARVNLVAEHCPELGVPPIGATDRPALIEQICHGAHSAKAVKPREVWPVLQQWLSQEQTAAVKAYAPEQVTLENGRKPRLHYDDPSGPYIAMRVQELYDTQKTPTICNGSVRVKVRILAPNQRPVQITDDLASFWQNGYDRVKKDLRGRYPKHEWR
ncbi:MAG: ATP-dependent helicase HrpB [Verrucomicrobia bacterium]|jgi:ATP-dependent helicase HrpB|nr:ATP-dependent helicase HrpB [Verrucomicrobiota bacterium]